MDKPSAGVLDLACCYLSGSIEYAKDSGVKWRRKFISLSYQAGLKLDFIDPTDKPGGENIKIGENKEHQAKLQREGRWRELQKYVHRYRRYDLRFVDNSDFLVAVIDPTVPQWGTANEIYFAEMQHKPIFFIIEGGLHKLPRWLFDVVNLGGDNYDDRCNVFETVEAVIEELVAFDHGVYILSDEWVLVRKHIEEGRQRHLEAHLSPIGGMD